MECLLVLNWKDEEKKRKSLTIFVNIKARCSPQFMVTVVLDYQGC